MPLLTLPSDWPLSCLRDNNAEEHRSALMQYTQIYQQGVMARPALEELRLLRSRHNADILVLRSMRALASTFLNELEEFPPDYTGPISGADLIGPSSSFPDTSNPQ